MRLRGLATEACRAEEAHAPWLVLLLSGVARDDVGGMLTTTASPQRVPCAVCQMLSFVLHIVLLYNLAWLLGLEVIHGDW